MHLIQIETELVRKKMMLRGVSHPIKTRIMESNIISLYQIISNCINFKPKRR